MGEIAIPVTKSLPLVSTLVCAFLGSTETEMEGGDEDKFVKNRVKNPLITPAQGEVKSLLGVDDVVAHAKGLLAEYEALFQSNKVSAAAAQGILRKAQKMLEEEFKRRTELKQKVFQLRTS